MKGWVGNCVLLCLREKKSLFLVRSETKCLLREKNHSALPRIIWSAPYER